MKTRFLLARFLAAVPLLLFLSGCQPKSLEERVASLPELPAEIADTLDAETLATKTVAETKPPETTPALIAAGPCCSISETRRLKVRFPFTKCGSPFDLFDLGGLVLTQGDRPAGAKPPELHRLTELRGRRLARLNLCVSSQGPWNAVLKENRACSPFTPVRTLTISALGDIIVFTWSGFQSPPANVQVVSCRTEGIIRTFCGELSTCDCSSAPCTVEAECQCPLQLPSGES